MPQSRLQRQHKGLLKMGQELVGASIKPFGDCSDIRRLLARFSGALRMHAAMEEEALYPELLSSPDAEVRRAASSLYDQLGGLYKQWDEFMERWPDADSIQQDKNRFRLQLVRVLATLERRMRKEDRELYPLAERHSLV